MAEEKNEQDQTNPNLRTNPEPGTESRPEATADELELLRKKIEDLQRSADSFKDQFIRKAAEFENYKRRTEADFANLIRNANEGLILSLVPILDDFARSLKAGKDLKEFEPFYRGVELMYNKFQKLLESRGVHPFDSVGQPFNVEYHDALLQIPRDDVPPNTVIEEVEKGYKLNGKVLRHAKVIVSAAADTSSEPADVPKNGDSKDSNSN